jgi:hypothetical protein
MLQVVTVKTCPINLVTSSACHCNMYDTTQSDNSVRNLGTALRYQSSTMLHQRMVFIVSFISSILALKSTELLESDLTMYLDDSLLSSQSARVFSIDVAQPSN